MTDDNVTVIREFSERPNERTKYEPRDDGGWWCVDQIRKNGSWRTRGRKAITNLRICDTRHD